ncbi:MAG: hypothetical protein HYZ75_17550 [Elusimicrobia bacterium]|nr:hypothetical protein [Elusimicrobiota bacterium]
MRRRATLWLLAGLAGCTSIPPEALPVAHNPSGAVAADIREPGPPVHAAAGARFVVRAADPARAKAVLTLAEDDYEDVMAHTGLYSFKPAGLYPVFVYSGTPEYLAKTGAPRWSGGIAVGNAIYSFEGPQLARTLAHEISHLIFHEYMGAGAGLRWFNEGLAVYMELGAAPSSEKPELEAWLRSSHDAPMSFGSLVRYVPGDARTKQWYGQSASLARFLVEVGGRAGVARFLSATRAGVPLERALAEAFPTICDGLASLERRWLLTKE